MSTDITSIKVSELWDVRDRDARTLTVMGYGRTPAEFDGNSSSAQSCPISTGLPDFRDLAA